MKRNWCCLLMFFISLLIIVVFSLFKFGIHCCFFTTVTLIYLLRLKEVSRWIMSEIHETERKTTFYKWMPGQPDDNCCNTLTKTWYLPLMPGLWYCRLLHHDTTSLVLEQRLLATQYTCPFWRLSAQLLQQRLAEKKSKTFSSCWI